MSEAVGEGRPMGLSKSRYVRGVQCPKMLWMERHMPEQFDESVLNAAVLETGNRVGDLAMGYYGDFVEVPFLEHDFEGMARLTRELVEAGSPVVCEATFSFEENVCMVDILRVEPDGVHLVEVKSSTHVRDVYLHDMAYQCWVLKRCGYQVKSAALMHLNREYVREGELDFLQLFTVEDRTAEVFALRGVVGENVERLRATACAAQEPCVAIGEQCTSPYPCGFRSWCWRDVPSPSVFDLAGWGVKKALPLYERGVATLADVANAPDVKLKGVAARQVEAARTGESLLMDAPAVARFLDGLTYPLYFLDFETYQPAIPPFGGVRPFEQIPTQYSLHIVERDDTVGAGAADGGALRSAGVEVAGGLAMSHREFLAQAGADPRRAIAEALVRDISADVCVVAYNMSFERAVLKSLAERFPDLAEGLLAIRSNMRDLMAPFRSGACYAAAQGGSFSIKAVLPALFPNSPELNYAALDQVHNGAQASSLFEEMALLPAAEQARARASLLRYCELDTLAMVRIWEKLHELVRAAS